VKARCETETELLAEKLFPQPHEESELYPSLNELLALKCAFSR
jgi:hypothetical protein